MIVCAYGGQMMSDIKEVYLSFDVKKTPTLNEARSLYLEIINRYLAKVNENVEVRPYLHNYPFTVKNLPFDLSFKDEKNQWHTDGIITFVMYSDRKDSIIYSTYDEENMCFIHVYEEPYEEAVKLASSDTKVIKQH